MEDKPVETQQDILVKKYPILTYFTYGHLPPHLQVVSQPFAAIAWDMLSHCSPENGAEIAAGLRKLLEAKDCFVRAALR